MNRAGLKVTAGGVSAEDFKRLTKTQQRAQNKVDAEAFRIWQAEKLMTESGFVKHVRADGTSYWTCTVDYS